MVPAFGRGAFLEQTLRSVLDQGASPDQMQITVVENPSECQDIAQILARLQSPQVEHIRHLQNLGMIGNWNYCVQHARGELVHILHDDDYVLPGFYRKVEDAAARRSDCGLFITRCIEVDEAGALERLSPRLPGLEKSAREVQELLTDNGIRCPGVVVRSSAYRSVGAFMEEIAYTADWDMWFRLIKASGAAVLNEPLAAYRCRRDNMSSVMARSGEMARAHGLMAERLAAADARLDRAEARSAAAWRAAFLAGDFARRGDAEAARANEVIWREFARPRDRIIRLLRRWLGRGQ